MEETKFQMRKAEARELLPKADLLPEISHKGEQLDMAIFGPSTYRGNKTEMEKQYFHSRQLPVISFVPAATSESISAAAYGFGEQGDFDAKRDIFDPRWLQAGYIVRTQEGVFTNTTLTDKKELKNILDNSRKIKGIWVYDGSNPDLKNVGFAPYDSFTMGVQDCNIFIQGGLARVLEHTEKKVAENLSKIASSKLYKRGVNVRGFGSVKEPGLRVATLYSYGDADGDWLDVGGNDWDDYDYGYALGVLNKSAEQAVLQNSIAKDVSISSHLV